MATVRVPVEPWMTEELASQYCFFEDEQCRIWYTGILAYREQEEIVYDVLRIVKKAISGTLNFNQLLGFYKIVIEEKSTKRTIFWGDHSGSQRFYISETVFSDSLPGCMKRLSDPTLPNHSAILQYFTLGRTLDDSTIVSNIQKTNQNRYYTLTESALCVHDKGLLSFSEQTQPYSLHELIKALAGGITPEHLSAVATGGTDSRTILAHLVELGYHPELFITGRGESEDMQVARKIADRISVPLHIYDSTEKEENWIQRAYDFSNGIYDVVLSHRHLRKAEQSKHHRLTYEFGGVGGEFYKNNFYLPFRDRQWRRNASTEHVFNRLAGNKIQNAVWFGPDLCTETEPTKKRLLALFQKETEPGVLRNFNKMGFILLSGGFCNITENIAPYATKIDPLMDRNVIAGVCRIPPLSLCMARWQRKEIHQHCPQLSDIETDQGYTCSLHPMVMAIESVKKLLYYSGLAIGRIRRKLFHEPKKKNELWDLDYRDAAGSPEYQASVQLCQSMGIISATLTPKDIPLNMVGFILMVGMTFSRYGKQG